MIWRWIFPPICSGCHLFLGRGESRFCKRCLSDLEPLSPEGRCVYCLGSSPCLICSTDPMPWDRGAAVWNYEGASKKWIVSFKKGTIPFDAEILARYLFIQSDRFQLSSPDFIVPVPKDPVKKIFSSFDPVYDLALILSELLKCKLFLGLKRRAGFPSQSTLRREERENLSSNQFQVVSGSDLIGKKVLLVDDIWITGRTLKSAAFSLSKSRPLKLEVLTLAKESP